MNKMKAVRISITLVFLFFVCSMTNLSNNISSFANLENGDWLKYQVNASSDTINDFYGNWPPGTYYGNWSVVPEDQIMFNITSIQGDEINGTLFIGNKINNSIFYNVRNIDIAFGLGLSIYPWFGGFLAEESNWDDILSDIQNTNTTAEQLSDYEHSVNNITNIYEVRRFDTEDYYGQFSEFYYHISTGILLRAYTSYGAFELNISLVSTSIEIDSYTAKTAKNFTSVLIVIVLISSILLIRKKHDIRKE